MNQYLKIPLLIIFANTCAFSQESEGGANLDPDTKVRISQVTFWGGSALLDDDGISPMINPQMTDEVNNENPLDYFPDGFPDKTGQPKPNQVKSYAYSYAATAQPTVEGLFRWKAGVPLAGGPYSASGEVIDTENCNFKLPKRELVGNVLYSATKSEENIVTQRKIQAYVTSNRKVKRYTKAGAYLPLVDMAAKLKPIKIRWTVYNNAGTPVGWSESLHTIYVTWDSPATILRQETLFNFACETCNNLTLNTSAEEKVALNKYFSEFEDLEVLRMDGTALSYYGASLAGSNNAKQLVSSGNGDCSAWSDFSLKIALINGMTSTHVMQITPYHLQTQTVAGHTIISSRPTGFDVKPLVKGQGAFATPSAAFDWHKVLTYGEAFTTDESTIAFTDNIHDVSYGRVSAGNLAWESSNVDLYYYPPAYTDLHDIPVDVDCIYKY